MWAVTIAIFLVLVTAVGGLIYLIVLAAGFHPVFWICWLVALFVVVFARDDHF